MPGDAQDEFLRGVARRVAASNGAPSLIVMGRNADQFGLQISRVLMVTVHSQTAHNG